MGMGVSRETLEIFTEQLQGQRSCLMGRVLSLDATTPILYGTTYVPSRPPSVAVVLHSNLCLEIFFLLWEWKKTVFLPIFYRNGQVECAKEIGPACKGP